MSKDKVWSKIDKPENKRIDDGGIMIPPELYDDMVRLIEQGENSALNIKYIIDKDGIREVDIKT